MMIKGGCGFLFVILIFIIWSYIRWGSVAYGLVWLQGEQLVVEPSSMDLRDVPCGERKKLSFRVKNLAAEPVHLLGANSSCSCLVTNDLPTIVPANGSCEIHAEFVVPSEAGKFTKDLVVYSELESQTYLVVQISGNAVTTEKNKK